MLSVGAGRDGRYDRPVAAPTDDPGELLCVVTADDELVELRPRHECNSDPALLHRSVYIAVETAAGMLFQRRGHGKDTNPGSWDLACAGHVDPGETYLDAARRELGEELGLVGAAPRRVGKLVLELGTERELCTVFHLRHDGPFTLRLPELIAIGAFRDDERPAPLSPGGEQILAWLARAR